MCDAVAMAFMAKTVAKSPPPGRPSCRYRRIQYVSPPPKFCGQSKITETGSLDELVAARTNHVFLLVFILHSKALEKK